MSSATPVPFQGRSKPVVSLFRRAAQYVRMSTDHQRYSIENQKQAIAEYALLHDLKIVRTYADEGRSGLNIKRRDALKRLLSDVQKADIGFEAILVYDVSRWGRFQDVDESAHYEFLCKAAGIKVIYCAELFENNDSALTALMKVMKRVMAGEYSRELSVKIARAHRFYAKRGFHQGGSRNYGLDRVLVDDSRRPKAILQDGQEKSFHSDRVVLVPGPKDEIAIVQEIFRMYTIERMSQREIVRLLNNKGIRNRRGNLWSASNMSKMLTNEKYGGTFVYSKTKWPLTGRHERNPPNMWVRVEGAIWLITAIKRSTIAFDEKKQVLVVNGCFTIAVVVLPYLDPEKNPQPGWKLYFDRLVDCDAIFVIRMDHTNTDALDFYLMPRNIFEKPSFRFTDERIKQLRRYKLRSVSRFEQAVKRMRDTIPGRSGSAKKAAYGCRV